VKEDIFQLPAIKALAICVARYCASISPDGYSISTELGDWESAFASAAISTSEIVRHASCFLSCSASSRASSAALFSRAESYKENGIHATSPATPIANISEGSFSCFDLQSVSKQTPIRTINVNRISAQPQSGIEEKNDISDEDYKRNLSRNYSEPDRFLTIFRGFMVGRSVLHCNWV